MWCYDKRKTQIRKKKETDYIEQVGTTLSTEKKKIRSK